MLLTAAPQDEQLLRDVLEEQGRVLDAEEAAAKAALAQRDATASLYASACKGQEDPEFSSGMRCSDLFGLLRHRAIVTEVAYKRMNAKAENVERFLDGVRLQTGHTLRPRDPLRH